MNLLISDIAAGTVLCERYTVAEKLGDGAVASVYLARDNLHDSTVALKILDPLRGADPVGRIRFEREFKVLEKINHPGVARCISLESDGELDILMLEHIEGETIASRLSRGRLPIMEAANIALHLAIALDACHREGVLHRDLKPANIILHPTRGPVILDFGVAWFSSAATLTRTGSIVGSPQYIAPEVFKSPVTDARADVYALGVILFEMLTGRPVQLADSLAEMAAAHLESEPPSVATLRPEVSPALSAIVARAIAPRAEERFATAGELAAALQRGVVVLGRSLQARLPCVSCRTSLIIDLPICPGCGREVAWELSAGPYAVQLREIPDIDECMKWLTTRHAGALTSSPQMARRRLHHPPVPLAVGASRVSAEQLLAEAENLGCKGEVVRARAILGTRLKASAASPGEILAASTLHFCAVAAATIIGAALFGYNLGLYYIPPGLALVGMIAAAIYVRRPMLAARPEAAVQSDRRALARVRELLSKLTTERARSLAAGAIARSAPVLLSDWKGLSSDARREVIEALERALNAARELDLHATALLSRPRSKLALEMDEARAKAERGESEAAQALAELEAERASLTETAIAHDLAARRVLEACQTISGVLAARAQAEQAVAAL